MIQLTCEQCRGTYAAKPYMASKSKRHFCGFACYGEWQKTHRIGVGRKRVSVACHTCGVTVEKQPHAVKGRNFCGRPCFNVWRSSDQWCGDNNPAWMGGHTTYRGPNWKRQSRAARKRDSDTCQMCGVVAARMPVHHVRPFHLFTDYREANKLENLLTLCAVCHPIAEKSFWDEHPELIGLRTVAVVPVVACRKCGSDYVPRSGAGRVCDACCTATCAHCASEFYSRKASVRPIKYCSRSCRHAHVKGHHSSPLFTSSPKT